MRNSEEIQQLLAYFKTKHHGELSYDEAAINATYKNNTEEQSLPIKILSVIGGILSSLAFMGFLFLTRLYENEYGLLVMGILCIIGAVLINKLYDKIILDTISVASYLMGFVLLGVAFSQFEMELNAIALLFIIIGFASYFVAQNYILSFISTLIITGSIISLILLNDYYSFYYGFIAIQALILLFLFNNEAIIINAHSGLNKLYYPIRTGIFCTLIACLIGMKYLIYFHFSGVLPTSELFIWASIIVFYAAIGFVVFKLMKLLKIQKTLQQGLLYFMSLLILIPMGFSLPILGAFFLLLMSFQSNYKLGIVVGIIAFIYFVCQFYYDLNLTLLTKSLLMMANGLLFIILYALTYNKLKSND